MTLLPFNLEEALKQPDRVVYRSGAKPLEWHWFEKCSVDNRLVTIMANKLPLFLRDNGKVCDNLISEHCYDLMLLPIPKKTYWVNVYEVQGKIQLSVPFESEEKAFQEIVLPLKLIKTISFTI